MTDPVLIIERELDKHITPTSFNKTMMSANEFRFQLREIINTIESQQQEIQTLKHACSPTKSNKNTSHNKQHSKHFKHKNGAKYCKNLFTQSQDHKHPTNETDNVEHAKLLREISGKIQKHTQKPNKKLNNPMFFLF